YGTHARLRAGVAEAPLRAAAPLVSSATLRRNACMRLTTRCGGGKGLPALWNGAGLLGLQMRQQCLLVAVPEARGVKLAGLAVENMLGQREHVRRNGEVGKVEEGILGLAHLIGLAQAAAASPLAV